MTSGPSSSLNAPVRTAPSTGVVRSSGPSTSLNAPVRTAPSSSTGQGSASPTSTGNGKGGISPAAAATVNRPSTSQGSMAPSNTSFHSLVSSALGFGDSEPVRGPPANWSLGSNGPVKSVGNISTMMPGINLSPADYLAAGYRDYQQPPGDSGGKGNLSPIASQTAMKPYGANPTIANWNIGGPSSAPLSSYAGGNNGLARIDLARLMSPHIFNSTPGQTAYGPRTPLFPGAPIGQMSDWSGALPPKQFTDRIETSSPPAQTATSVLPTQTINPPPYPKGFGYDEGDGYQQFAQYSTQPKMAPSDIGRNLHIAEYQKAIDAANMQPQRLPRTQAERIASHQQFARQQPDGWNGRGPETPLTGIDVNPTSSPPVKQGTDSFYGADLKVPFLEHVRQAMTHVNDKVAGLISPLTSRFGSGPGFPDYASSTGHQGTANPSGPPAPDPVSALVNSLPPETLASKEDFIAYLQSKGIDLSQIEAIWTQFLHRE